MRLLPLLLLVACQNKVEVGDPDEGTPEDDSGVEEIIDDTGDTGDTGEPIVGTDLTFYVEGDADGNLLALTWYAGDDARVYFGDQAASSVILDGRAVLTVPDPDPSELVELNPEAYPGTYLAFYYPTIHVDADGDGAHGSYEEYLAGGLAIPIYVGGTFPADFAAMGMSPGWNVLVMVPGSDVAVGTAPTDDIPIEVNLTVNESLTIGGDVADIEDGDNLRLMLFPGGAADQGWVSELLYDEPLDGAWEISVSGEPPVDHYAPEESGLELTQEFPMSYWDNDASGSPSDGDAGAWAACFGDAAVTLYWIPAPTTIEAAMTLTWAGLPAGWTAAAYSPDGSGAFLEGQDATSLLIGTDACAWE